MEAKRERKGGRGERGKEEGGKEKGEGWEVSLPQQFSEVGARSQALAKDGPA